jgi:hypothetical protein
LDADGASHEPPSDWLRQSPDGKLDAAIPPLEKALDICQTAKLSLVFDGTASALGYAYVAGRLADVFRCSSGLCSNPRRRESTTTVHEPPERGVT